MLGLLTAFGLAACDDSSDLGIQQQNPQEAIMEANGLTVAWQSPIQGNTLSLPAYKDQAIPVISTVETKDLPAGATIDYEMQIASNADFSDAQTVAVENGAVLESDWDNAFKAIPPLASTTSASQPTSSTAPRFPAWAAMTSGTAPSSSL